MKTGERLASIVEKGTYRSADEDFLLYHLNELRRLAQEYRNDSAPNNAFGEIHAENLDRYLEELNDNG